MYYLKLKSYILLKLDKATTVLTKLAYFFGFFYVSLLIIKLTFITSNNKKHKVNDINSIPRQLEIV